MNSLRLFQPQRPEDVHAFMESVQIQAPPIHRQIIDTGKLVARAIAGTGITIATAPLALAEGAFYFAANILAVPSTVLNKVGSITNRTRTKLFNAVMGR